MFEGCKLFVAQFFFCLLYLLHKVFRHKIKYIHIACSHKLNEVTFDGGTSNGPVSC